MTSKEPLRLVLIGKTGAGKSKTGNTIFGKIKFESSPSATSVTQFCQLYDETVNGRRVSIIDTPGLLDNRKEAPDVLQEITRSIYLSTPGPHAIVLVVQIGRFTYEDVYTLEKFVKHFGEELFRYIVIIFTRFDDFKRDQAEKKKECNIHAYIESLPAKEHKFVTEKCSSRIIGFDNTLTGKEAEPQINQLFEIIDNLIAQNGGRFYTNEDYQLAEEAVKRQMEKDKIEIQKKMQEEKDKRQKEIEAASDLKMKDMLKEEMEKRDKMWREKMESENLRRDAQQSQKDEFSKFQMMVSVITKLSELGLKAYELYIQKERYSY